jgi:hypothetical protein
MISIILCGGLGNQLFQIFATIAYALKYKHRFVFEYTEKLPYGPTVRHTFWETFLSPLKKFTTINPSNGFNNSQIWSLPVDDYSPHNFHHFREPKHANQRIHGYFQSYKYFKDYQEIIFSLIHLEEQTTSIKNEFSYLFDDAYHSISMHFRLGDYKYLQECHNVLGYSYYERSLSYILSKLSIPVNEEFKMKIKVLYFCEKEDNKTVSEHIERLNEKWRFLEFVKVDDAIADWKQMLIMSLCNSNIIANSTFSLWGAYFNLKKENKHVCYPSVWFGPCLNHNFVDDMFLDDWVKIDA